MEMRYESLHQTMAGLEKTGIPLIAYNGTLLEPAGSTYIQGIHYFIPKIAHYFDTSLDNAMMFFYFGWNITALSLGLLGVLLLFRTWLSKAVSVLALAILAVIVLSHGYIYSFLASAVVATGPLLLYFCKKKSCGPGFIAFCFLAGIWLSISNSLRDYAGVGPLIFMATILAFYIRVPWKVKGILMGAAALGVLVPFLYMNSLINQRNEYLAIHVPGKPYLPKSTFWHSIYIGFGYLENDLGIRYNDGVANAKAVSIYPDAVYQSPEYNVILRNEVFRIFKEHPYFALKTLAAKGGKMALFLLIFANIGLVAAVLYPKERGLDLAFFLGLLFQSSYGFLVMPRAWYLLGFIAFATIYGIVSINEALERGCLRDAVKMFKGLRKII